MDRDKLAGIIVEAREKLGMNQGEASLHCGFSETYLGMIERGTRPPGPRALLSIMTRLGIGEGAMREFLPQEFHNLYEAPQPEYPRLRENLLGRASSEESKKELKGTGFSSLEGFICEFLFDYWSHALDDGLLLPEDLRYDRVDAVVSEVKNAHSSRTFTRMLEIFDEEEPAPGGRSFSLLSILRDWRYDREGNQIILRVVLVDTPGKERVYRLKLKDDIGDEGASEPAWEEIEKVRSRAMDDGRFWELPEGLRALIYDEDAFHGNGIREGELEYLKRVELRGTGGEPTKEGFLMELDRFRSVGGGSADDTLLIGKGRDPGLFEIVNKILNTDEKMRERVVQAIGPAVEAIIDASSFQES